MGPRQRNPQNGIIFDLASLSPKYLLLSRFEKPDPSTRLQACIHSALTKPSTSTAAPPAHNIICRQLLFIIMQGNVDCSSATGSKCSLNIKNNQQPENNKANPLPLVHKIISITAESLSQTQEKISIVDPWVPRIANNDDYLQLGLDFSVGSRHRGGSADTKEGALQDTIISPFVGDIGATRLGNALSNNNLLLYLNLSNNRIGMQGGIELAHALHNGNKSRTALRRLNLPSNCISDDGAAAFQDALIYNDTLEELNLSDNGMGINGVLALLEGLRHNGVIRIMKLCDNLQSLGDTEMERLIKNTSNVLKKNSADLNGGRLEVLEMGDGTKNDLFDTDIHSNTLIHAMSCFDAEMIKRGVNHRFRRLTLPVSEAHGQNNNLSRLLGFNSFYHPIIELYDIIESNHNESDSIVSPAGIPIHLQRDEETGALIGLLPSTSSGQSGGIPYKLLPKVLAFATTQCTIETAFNLIRYRPDMFFCVHSNSTKVVGCSPNGCSIL